MPNRVRKATTPASESAAIWNACAAVLATRAEMWRALLDEHVRTADGLCAGRTCGRPGRGTPYQVWPCSTRAIADAARRIHEQGTP